MVTVILIAILIPLALLVGYEVKKRNWVSLGLSLGVIAVVLFICMMGYRIQLRYDHIHMTEILRRTADAIEEGHSEEVVAAYSKFEERRREPDVSFWGARNELHKELMEIDNKH